MDSKGKSRRKGALWVVCSKGSKQRFLRGVLTHDLVLRGLPFDDAYTVARAVREDLADRDEVSTAEIRDRVQEQVETLFGGDVSARLRSSARPAPSDLTVIYQGQHQPFSRGLLARSIQAAGLDLDRAYRLVTELEGNLRQEGVEVIASSEVALRVGEILERLEGEDLARRYRVVRRIHKLPRPLVVYVGGASGTGKSTLSLELAPLLRIYRVTATDTVRQVMRMLFSPQILPSLYGSSFDATPSASLADEADGEDDFPQRITGAFLEQAVRVGVGVRAVVERAVAENMSVLVEGVHLFPPIVPFSDLEGACYQVPLVLTTSDIEEHRSRFLARARFGGRRAERYVENFDAIRAIQEMILEQAEAEEVPLVDTYSGDATARSLRLVVSMLEKQLPDSLFHGAPEAPRAPTLLVVVDGLADRPVRALGGRTPLQAAETPTFDRLAREGQCGLADPIAPGVVPDTAAGTLALFAQSPLALKRGPVEAIGAGVKLSLADIALRANFATLDDQGHVVDRRAGRIREGTDRLVKALDDLPLPGSLADEVKVRVAAATEHRLTIVLRGEGLSPAVRGSDPGDGAAGEAPLVPDPMDPNDERAVYTARVLALFEQEARRVLARHPVNKARRKDGLPEANALLSRGAGRIHRLVPLEDAGLPLRVSCIAGDQTILGIARWLGAETVFEPGMTANLDTDLGLKFDLAVEALGNHDLVVLHLKGADIAAHDGRPDLKAGFLEDVDRQLGRLLDVHPGPLRVAIAADHATLSESGQHSADPLPVVIWGDGIEADEVELYDETSVAPGALQRFPLQLLLGRLFDLG
ncbi:MAG: ATP cone domain-containing protein [Acidobacteriota bacterium]